MCPDGGVEDVAGLVLVDLDREPVGGVAGDRIDAVRAEELRVRAGYLGLRQVGLPHPRHERLRTVGSGRGLKRQAILDKGVGAPVVRPRAARVEAGLDVVRDDSLDVVDRERSEVRRVAPELRQRLVGGRPGFRVRHAVGTHDGHAHVPGSVVDEVSETVFERGRKKLVVGAAAFDACQRPRAYELALSRGEGPRRE